MNINININNNSNSKDANFPLSNLQEILDSKQCLDIMKKKLDKKKEKLKNNILNFSNPAKVNIPNNLKFLIDSSKNNSNINGKQKL